MPAGRDPESARIEREKVLHTFGNLTLLTKKLNPSVSNGAGARVNDKGVDKGKRAEVLRHSTLGINSMLLDFDQWDERAKKLWPHPGPIEQKGSRAEVRGQLGGLPGIVTLAAPSSPFSGGQSAHAKTAERPSFPLKRTHAVVALRRYLSDTRPTSRQSTDIPAVDSRPGRPA